MQMNVLNTEVSFFSKCTGTANPKAVNLLEYLHSVDYRAAVDRVRSTEDKKKRDLLKKALLPGITPAGVFTYRDEKGLIKPSGLLAGDIDFQDNPYNPESIKARMMNIKNVAYCGLSVSGRGLWFLVPLTCPDRYKEHFDALRYDFTRLGIALDPAPANIASFRFYSFDPAAYFNPEAVPYSKFWRPMPEAYTPKNNHIRVTGDEGEKLEAVIRQIEAQRLDITGNYRQWFSLLSSLATLGEAGRDYAHRISQFYSTYSSRETDRQFNYCLRMRSNRFSLATLFKIAKEHRITFRGYFELKTL